MNKVFEDYFSELQTDMVSICLEYVEDRANKIYIYCSFEDNVIASDYFYNINREIVERHKINDIISSHEEKYDTSIERQKGVVRILNNDMKNMIRLCREYKREMPTEMKLVYDVLKTSLKAEYKYDLVYSNDPIKEADDIAMKWFEELKKGN